MSIYLELMGGLGNQLFQLCTAAAEALRHKVTVQIKKNTHDDHGRRIMLDVVNHLVVEQELQCLQQGEPFNGSFDVHAIQLGLPCTQITGYRQHKDYFDYNFESIYEYCTLHKLLPLNIPYNTDDKTLAIHIRRGDYVKLPNFDKTSIDNYYLPSIQKYFSHCSTIYIFSDDPLHSDVQTLKNHLESQEKSVSIVHNTSEYNDFRALATFAPNMLIGNSTFAWWAAYIPHRILRNKLKVVIPDKWIDLRHPRRMQTAPALIPDGWICAPS